MKKKKVVIFIDWYLPGLNAGGPVRTCANMVGRLNDEFDFKIITRNTDLKENIPYSDVVTNDWNNRPDGSQVYYISSDQLTYKNILKLLTELNPDAVHLNSMFSFYFTILPILAIKRNKLKAKIVAGPRGMLSKGALAIKPIKKKLFLTIAKTSGIFKNVTWHASTEVEKKEIENIFGTSVIIKTAIDLAAEKTMHRVSRIKTANHAKLFYLGRISPVKNPLQCLQTLKNVNAVHHLQFDIYGPVEDQQYWEECQEIIKQLPAHVEVNYKGLVDNDDLKDLLPGYHFLFLLSENENYGHAIVEALGSGCPVIIGDRTPWRNLQSEKAGWDLPLENQEKINAVINSICEMEQQTYNVWSKSAYDKAENITRNKESVDANKNLFRD